MHPFSSPWFSSSFFFFFFFLLLLFLLSSSPSSAALHNYVRISATDVAQRSAAQRLVQQAAFQQFRSVHKTGKIYNVSVPSLDSAPEAFQAVRLRSGSLTRKGAAIADFNLPVGSKIDSPIPPPLRILLVYTRFLNLSSFQNLPEASGFGAVAVNAPVVSLLAYDATGILDSNRTDDLLEPLPLSASAAAPISILFGIGGGSSAAVLCASFDQSTANVNYSQPAAAAAAAGSSAKTVCEALHLGTFASVSPAAVVPPPPASSGRSSKSGKWKIVVGAVVGGVVLVAAVAVAAVAAKRGWERAKVGRMQRRAEQEETLKSTEIRNTRAPAAGDTRTKPKLETDYVT